MPTFKKIPKKYKKVSGVAIGGFFIFANVGILTASGIATRLSKKGIPAYGRLTYKGKKYYYCRYGLTDDPDIFT